MARTDCSRTVLVLATAGCLSGLALAQDGGVNPKVASPPPLAKGDIIRLDVDYLLAPHATGSSEQPANKTCFKRGTKFEVVSTAAGETLLRPKSSSVFGKDDGIQDCANQAIDRNTAGTDLYSTGSTAIPVDYYRHSGITHGALVVPFKRRSDHTLSGESHLGYFLGYRIGTNLGVTITPAFSAGMSLVNVADDTATTANSKRDSGTRAAFTWSAGFILNHLDAFQIGVFVGKDRLGGDVGAAWKYEGKYWTSVAFGYAFSR